jgi:hypothetical protein
MSTPFKSAAQKAVYESYMRLRPEPQRARYRGSKLPPITRIARAYLDGRDGKKLPDLFDTKSVEFAAYKAGEDIRSGVKLSEPRVAVCID